jgi:hypothetical protein
MVHGQAAVVGDVGGLAGPGRQRAQARHHQHQRAIASAGVSVAIAQQRRPACPGRHRRRCAWPAAWPPKCSTTSTHRQARRHHRRTRPPLPRLHGRRAGLHPGAAELRAAGLRRPTPSRSAPRSTTRSATASRRQGAEERRHRQPRHHRDQGRLARRHQPHVRGRRRLDPCRASACARSPTSACGSASPRCARAPRLGDIGHAIQKHAEGAGFSVVREFCGHGIGRKFHEEPQVLHYGKPGTGEPLLVPGMIFTIEPMINAGKREIRELPTAGPSSPRTAACRHSGSTRCWSPRPASRC